MHSCHILASRSLVSALELVRLERRLTHEQDIANRIHARRKRGIDWHNGFLNDLHKLFHQLQVKGHDDEAVNLLQHIAIFNRATLEMEPSDRPDISTSLSLMNKSIKLLGRQSYLYAVIRWGMLPLYHRAFELEPAKQYLIISETLVDWSLQLHADRDPHHAHEHSYAINQARVAILRDAEKLQLQGGHDEMSKALLDLRWDLAYLGRYEDAVAVGQERVRLLKHEHDDSGDFPPPSCVRSQGFS